MACISDFASFGTDDSTDHGVGGGFNQTLAKFLIQPTIMWNRALLDSLIISLILLSYRY